MREIETSCMGVFYVDRQFNITKIIFLSTDSCTYPNVTFYCNVFDYFFFLLKINNNKQKWWNNQLIWRFNFEFPHRFTVIKSNILCMQLFLKCIMTHAQMWWHSFKFLTLYFKSIFDPVCMFNCGHKVRFNGKIPFPSI